LQLDIVNTVKSTLVPDGHPFMTGVFTPNHVECNAADLTVIGTIPGTLNGVYLRNTQNPVHQPLGKYHAFDGDGMLHLMSFKDGRCEYRNRFVPTKGFMEEQEAGGALYAGLIDNPKLAKRPGWGARGGLRDTAATDVIVHAGSALATFYQCGEPYRMDARTLAFKGTAPWHDKVMPDGISAHPKVDPGNGELLFFNYSKQAPYMHFGVVDANDTLVHYVPVELPGPRLPHDMAFTKNYAILNDFPLFWDPELLAQGKHKVVYRPELRSRFAIVPRRGGAVRWFDAGPTYVLHWLNAWEEGDEIVLVGCRVADPLPPEDPRDGAWANMMANLRITANLHRWRFNLVTGETREEQLDDRNAEFPSVDPRVVGARSRHAYSMILGDEPTLRFTGVMKYDTGTGASQAWEWGPGRYGSESPFAPRTDAGAEDDGYLVSFVHDERENRSEVAVLRADDLAAGPVARVLLPQRVPLGFHACWVPGALG
jgi:carotenoid cleavage dioxygenase